MWRAALALLAADASAAARTSARASPVSPMSFGEMPTPPPAMGQMGRTQLWQAGLEEDEECGVCMICLGGPRVVRSWIQGQRMRHGVNHGRCSSTKVWRRTGDSGPWTEIQSKRSMSLLPGFFGEGPFEGSGCTMWDVLPKSSRADCDHWTAGAGSVGLGDAAAPARDERQRDEGPGGERGDGAGAEDADSGRAPTVGVAALVHEIFRPPSGSLGGLHLAHPIVEEPHHLAPVGPGAGHGLLPSHHDAYHAPGAAPHGGAWRDRPGQQRAPLSPRMPAYLQHSPAGLLRFPVLEPPLPPALSPSAQHMAAHGGSGLHPNLFIPNLNREEARPRVPRLTLQRRRAHNARDYGRMFQSARRGAADEELPQRQPGGGNHSGRR